MDLEVKLVLYVGSCCSLVWMSVEEMAAKQKNCITCRVGVLLLD